MAPLPVVQLEAPTPLDLQLAAFARRAFTLYWPFASFMLMFALFPAYACYALWWWLAWAVLAYVPAARVGGGPGYIWPLYWVYVVLISDPWMTVTDLLDDEDFPLTYSAL